MKPLLINVKVNVNGNGVFVLGGESFLMFYSSMEIFFTMSTMLIPGGTSEQNSDGTFKTNSPPQPTQHIHLFHTQVIILTALVINNIIFSDLTSKGPNANKWSSSLTGSTLVKGTVVLPNMNVPRLPWQWWGSWCTKWKALICLMTWQPGWT